MSAAFENAGYVDSITKISPSEFDPLLKNHHIFSRRYEPAHSEKEPLLLIHGHPQNHLVYHRLAPALAKTANRTVIVADLRGHGRSGAPQVRNIGEKNEGEKPSEDALRARYSKREMARDLVEVMAKEYRINKFAVVGHDRGGRVAHRMALEYPDRITRVMVLDIAPTFDLYNKTDSTFATTYWHWFFLIQPYPFPENMISAHPEGYLDKMLTRFNKKELQLQNMPDRFGADTVLFPPEIVNSYLEQLSSREHLHATCEDYRCSAPGGIDYEMDEADRKAGRKVSMPLRVLWGAEGINEKLFGDGVVDLWKNVCQEATGRSYPCGHYMPEEIPQELEQEILTFFK